MSSCLDSLSHCIDAVRECAHGSVGDRPYHVYVVKRRWTGGRRGEGESAIVSDEELTPTPLLTYETDLKALHNQLNPQGREEEGQIKISEVSFSFLEPELTGGDIARNEDFYYRVTDESVGSPARYYVPNTPPHAARGEGIEPYGWFFYLRRAEVQE